MLILFIFKIILQHLHFCLSILNCITKCSKEKNNYINLFFSFVLAMKHLNFLQFWSSICSKWAEPHHHNLICKWNLGKFARHFWFISGIERVWPVEDGKIVFISESVIQIINLVSFMSEKKVPRNIVITINKKSFVGEHRAPFEVCVIHFNN